MMPVYGHQQSTQAILREYFRRILAGIFRHGDDNRGNWCRLCAFAPAHEATLAVPHASDRGVREEF